MHMRRLEFEADPRARRRETGRHARGKLDVADLDPRKADAAEIIDAVERAVDIAKANGAKRAMLLPVSAPFHCALMQPAADVMAEALSKVAVNAPAVPVVSNVKASALSDPAEIVKALVAQVTGTVRWRESVAYLAQQGVTTFYEIGAGKVLSGLIKRIADGANATSIGTPAEVEAFKAAR